MTRNKRPNAGGHKKAGSHKDEERNKLILEMAKEYSSPEIERRMKALGYNITRSAVIGVIGRHLGKSPRSPEDLQRQRSQVAARLAKARRAAEGPGAPGFTISPSARTIAERAAGILPPAPLPRKPSEPSPLPRYAYEPAPPTAVPLLDVTGCRWMYGGMDGEPYLCCNATRCKVRKGGEVYTVNYCAEHWHRRRASQTTKVIAA